MKIEVTISTTDDGRKLPQFRQSFFCGNLAVDEFNATAYIENWKRIAEAAETEISVDKEYVCV